MPGGPYSPFKREEEREREREGAPWSFDQPSCPGEREGERERERAGFVLASEPTHVSSKQSDPESPNHGG